MINLQWTPKDSGAYLKINGYCDAILRHLAVELGVAVPAYNGDDDPLFNISTPAQNMYVFRQECKFFHIIVCHIVLNMPMYFLLLLTAWMGKAQGG